MKNANPYPILRAWSKMIQLPYEIFQALLKQAQEDNAPKDAIWFEPAYVGFVGAGKTPKANKKPSIVKIAKGKWRTLKSVKQASTRQYIRQLAEAVAS